MKINIIAVAALSLGLSGLACADLVTNGSFETGDFTGWTQFGNSGFSGVTTDWYGVGPTDGTYEAYFGPIGGVGGITQTLTTTVGSEYLLTYDLYNFGGVPNEFDLTVGGVDGIPPSGYDLNTFGYTSESYTFTATATTTDLSFGFQQNPAYFLLDNVHVNAVPEPITMTLAAAGLGLAARRRMRKAA